MPAEIVSAVGVFIGMLTIVTLMYVIRDRRASLFKGERDAERDNSDALMHQLGVMTAERDELLKTRDLEPVLRLISSVMEQVTRGAEIQQRVLDKLVTVNGSLDHVRVGLEEAIGAFQLAHEITIASRKSKQ